MNSSGETDQIGNCKFYRSKETKISQVTRNPEHAMVEIDRSNDLKIIFRISSVIGNR